MNGSDSGPDSTPLVLGGVAAQDLVGRFGSPLYVMEADTVRGNFRRLAEAFAHPAVRILYALKANPNLRIAELLLAEGAGADCCSPGEVQLAMAAGFSPGEISFTGTALVDEEAAALARHGVTVNVDSLSQLDRYLPLFPGGLGVRVNPGRGAGLHSSCTTGGEDSKLGIPWDQVSVALEIARKHGSRIRGLHVHTGSGGLDVAHFESVATAMFDLAESLGARFDYLDLGGGIGVPHAPGDGVFDISRYGATVSRLLERWRTRRGGTLRLFIEPGQYLVSDAGWLLMTVVIRKETPWGRVFIITDSSFNHYLGTALYQSYHEFLKATDTRAPRTEVVDICGHLCNTGDTFARARKMPALREGDLVAMVNAGAYGLSRAATYNSRPIPAEVLVQGGEARLIRRRQRLEELLTWQE